MLPGNTHGDLIMNTQERLRLGASLSGLKVGDRAIVQPTQKLDDRTRHKLSALGIRAGTLITLEQRSPRFMVRVGMHRVALDNSMIHALEVRV
jgi:ferrous iron transport protein A